MNKIIIVLICCLFASETKAQQDIPKYEPYGKVNKEDLEMKDCDFEKDANAEILINKGELYYNQAFNVIMDCYKRIKIFNDNGKHEANIRIPYHSFNHGEYITGIQAETINLTDGKQEITKLDKKQIFTQVIDKYTSVIVFSMPNVKPGSIIEYKYSWYNTQWTTIPTWYFQSTKAPIRYSELYTHIPEYFYFSRQTHTLSQFAINETKTESGSIGSGSGAINYRIDANRMAMVNIPSLPDEFLMRSSYDNLQSISFQLTSFKPPYGFVNNISDTWAKVGGELADDDDFGKQLKRKLTGEDVIIADAKALKTDDAKIAYLFNTVRNTMKWNGDDEWYTLDGTSEAWNKKTGNSTEINLALYHLLKKSGIAALPMVVSTRDHGRVNITCTSLAQFNRAVVYIPVDSTKRYILDATGKYNMYNEIPYEILNSDGLYLDMDEKSYDILLIDKTDPVQQSVYINAEIKPDGKLAGTAQLNSFSYNRITDLDKYNTYGEKKYIDYLRDDDNNLKISALKVENMDVDTLPLIQDIDFSLDLTGSDDNYIYFNPNLFTSLHANPFMSETRHTDIDFGYLHNLAINGVYTLPAGYKVDALPKNLTMTTPDQGMIFRRVVAEQDGKIAVRYIISYQKSIYLKKDYADFHEFFKKLYEMLNEQIVLKKS